MQTLTALFLAATCAALVGCAATPTKEDAEKQRVVRKANQIVEGCIRAGYAWNTDEHRNCMFPQLIKLMDAYHPVPGETDEQKIVRLEDLVKSMPPETDSEKIARAIYDACNRSFVPGSIEALDCVVTRTEGMYRLPRSSHTTVCVPAPGGVFVCPDN
jgi:hypothetical protein